MATFTEEEFEQLLRDFEDNAPSDFGENLGSNIDLFEVELPQPPNFNTTPRPMDTTQSLEVQLAETQRELRSVKSAFEDSMKTMDKLVQLHAELRSMKSLVEGLVHYMERLGPWTAEVTAALQKLGEPPLSAT